MTRKANTSLDFLAQVQQLAPSVHSLITSQSARITSAMTTHDAVNGYGHGFTFHLKLEVFLEQCVNCGETPASRPVLECLRHRMERRYMQIADAEAPTLEKALRKLNSVIQIRERIAA